MSAYNRYFAWTFVGVLAASTLGCDPKESAISIDFAARIDGVDVVCGDALQVGTDGDTATLADLRLYIHDLEVIDRDGIGHPVTLDAGPFQNARTALLDFEDGSGDCEGTGSAEMHTTVTGTVAVDDPAGLRLTLGVPFDANHDDVATSTAPLDVPAMYWSWQGGYKFVRLDLAAGDGFSFHLGSSGCDSTGAVIAPEEPCERPNRPVVTADGNPFEDTFVFDIGALLGGTSVATAAADATPCMSQPANEAVCTSIFDRLGLDFSTGLCAEGCDDQTVFTAVTP